MAGRMGNSLACRVVLLTVWGGGGFSVGVCELLPVLETNFDKTGTTKWREYQARG
jgi:hypothetical protein